MESTGDYSNESDPEGQNISDYFDEDNSEKETILENQYYESKLIKPMNPSLAIFNFQKVLALQGAEKGEWGFKALKQIIKISIENKKYNDTFVNYKELLAYVTCVSRNQSEKAINNILSRASLTQSSELLCLFYETTIDTLKKLKNKRLWFKINIKLGQLYCEEREFAKLSILIQELTSYLETTENEEEIDYKNAQLLEIYSLEIQMCNIQNNFSQLRKLYKKSTYLKSSITNPLAIATIKECGGKIHLQICDYSKALTDFYEAFKNYYESGSNRKYICLKYVILSTMLTKLNINHLDSKESKQYRNNKEVKTIAELSSAYQENDILKFEKILKRQESSVINDVFVIAQIDHIRKNLRTKVLLNAIKPYKVVKINFISNILQTDDVETENLLISCILDNLIQGKINQVNKSLILRVKEESRSPIYNAFENLIEIISHLQLTILEKL